MSDEAKAVEELAKASGKAIDATREVGGWLDRIFGGALEDTVGRLWTDRARARRIEAAIHDWSRLETLLRNTEKKLRGKGITTTRVVPPKIALPLLEHATMEHEDDLHALWENLLVSALDPTEQEIKRTYVSTLGEMGAMDAHVLRRIYAEWLFWDTHQVPDYRRNTEHRYSSGIEIENAEAAVLFHRLGLVLPVHIPVEEYRNRSDVRRNDWDRNESEYYVGGGDRMLALGDLSTVALTDFGEKFCKAVIGDASGNYEPPDWAKNLKRRVSEEPVARGSSLA